MSFGSNTTTKKGLALIAKLLAGDSIEFTKMVSSTADYSSSNLQEITSLTDVKQTISISSVKATTESVVEITGIFKNTELNTGYNLKTIGLFARDPQEGEILFSVCASNKDIFMPDKNGGLSSKTFTLATQINNANNATFTITDSAAVPVAEFNQYKTSTGTKLDNLEKNKATKEEVLKIDERVKTNTTNIAQLSNPNLLINGDFQVWQRGTTFATNSGLKYSADRWKIARNEQVVEKTDNGIKVTITNPTTHRGGLTQQIEFDKKYIASDITLSAKIKNTSSVYFAVRDKGYTTSYTEKVIGSNADWTIVSVTGNVGTITDNIISVEISNQTQVNNTIEIAWVKLELGSVATPFVPRSYGEELALCQRYYEKLEYVGNDNGATTNVHISLPFKVEKRVIPTRKDIGTMVWSGSWLSSPVQLTAFAHTKYCFCEVVKPSNGTTNIGDFHIKVESDAEIY